MAQRETDGEFAIFIAHVANDWIFQFLTLRRCGYFGKLQLACLRLTH
jgi:hypothetical protein